MGEHLTLSKYRSDMCNYISTSCECAISKVKLTDKERVIVKITPNLKLCLGSVRVIPAIVN